MATGFPSDTTEEWAPPELDFPVEEEDELSRSVTDPDDVFDDE